MEVKQEEISDFVTKLVHSTMIEPKIEENDEFDEQFMYNKPEPSTDFANIEVKNEEPENEESSSETPSSSEIQPNFLTVKSPPNPRNYVNPANFTDFDISFQFFGHLINSHPHQVFSVGQIFTSYRNELTCFSTIKIKLYFERLEALRLLMKIGNHRKIMNIVYLKNAALGQMQNAKIQAIGATKWVRETMTGFNPIFPRITKHIIYQSAIHESYGHKYCVRDVEIEHLTIPERPFDELIKNEFIYKLGADQSVYFEKVFSKEGIVVAHKNNKDKLPCILIIRYFPLLETELGKIEKKTTRAIEIEIIETFPLVFKYSDVIQKFKDYENQRNDALIELQVLGLIHRKTDQRQPVTADTMFIIEVRRDKLNLLDIDQDLEIVARKRMIEPLNKIVVTRTLLKFYQDLEASTRTNHAFYGVVKYILDSIAKLLVKKCMSYQKKELKTDVEYEPKKQGTYTLVAELRRKIMKEMDVVFSVKDVKEKLGDVDNQVLEKSLLSLESMGLINRKDGARSVFLLVSDVFVKESRESKIEKVRIFDKELAVVVTHLVANPFLDVIPTRNDIVKYLHYSELSDNQDFKASISRLVGIMDKMPSTSTNTEEPVAKKPKLEVKEEEIDNDYC